MKNTTTGGEVASLHKGLQGIRSPLEKRTNKRFPHKIMLAVTAVSTGGIFGGLLKNSEREVFSFLVRLASAKNPMKPSWAFKKTMAEALGISEPTVYRALNELESKNLITRIPKTSYVSLTEHACLKLGLLGEAEDANLPSPKNTESESGDTPAIENEKLPEYGHSSRVENAEATNKMIDAYSGVNFPSENQTTQSIQKHSAGARTVLMLDPKRPGKRFAIPAELFFLIEKNLLSPSQLCMFMGRFTKIKQRFSDVVACQWNSIQKLKLGEAVRYFTKLLSSPTDFSFKVKQARIQQETAAAATREKAEIQAWVVSSHGQWFTNAKGTAVGRIDARVKILEMSWLANGYLASGSRSLSTFTKADAERLIPLAETEAIELLEKLKGQATKASQQVVRGTSEGMNPLSTTGHQALQDLKAILRIRPRLAG